MTWLVVALMCVGAIACDSTDTPLSANDAARLGLSLTEANNLRATAMDAARSEKYDGRRANFTLRKDGEHYKGDFAPKAKDATGRLNVPRVLHGQQAVHEVGVGFQVGGGRRVDDLAVVDDVGAVGDRRRLAVKHGRAGTA